MKMMKHRSSKAKLISPIIQLSKIFSIFQMAEVVLLRQPQTSDMLLIVYRMEKWDGLCSLRCTRRARLQTTSMLRKKRRRRSSTIRIYASLKILETVALLVTIWINHILQLVIESPKNKVSASFDDLNQQIHMLSPNQSCSCDGSSPQYDLHGGRWHQRAT